MDRIACVLGCAGIAALTACYDKPGAADDAGTSTSEGSTTTPSTSDPSTTTESTTGGSSSGSPTSMTDPSGSESSTGTVQPMCGDGMPSAGELCLPDSPALTEFGEAAVDLAVGDFDGNLGVATANGASVSIFYGDGDGGFAGSETMPVPDGAVSIVAGDLEPDGDADLVTLGADAVSVILSNGDGTFATPDPQPDTSAFLAEESWLSIGQINGTTPLDVAYGEGYNTFLLAGSTAGGFHFNELPGGQMTGGDTVIALTEFNWDGDGFTDFIVMSRWEARVTVATGDGAGNMASHAQFDVCTAGSCAMKDVAGADLNGDDEVDVIAAFAGGISVSLGQANSSFDPFVPYDLTGAGHLATGDLDNDGDTDVVVPATDGQLHVYLGVGDGTLEDPIAFDITTAVLDVVEIADLNGDGALDLITTYSANGMGQVAVLLADP